MEGPLKTNFGYTVFQVERSTPESVQELSAVEGQIENTLAERVQEESFREVIDDFNARWKARTFCDEGYIIEMCANYEDDGHPSSAPPACYEEDPDGGDPQACPAPVFQAAPAVPGTVTPLSPQGNQLVQRPVLAGEAPKPTGEEGATGLPPGAAPPPSESPAE